MFRIREKFLESNGNEPWDFSQVASKKHHSCSAIFVASFLFQTQATEMNQVIQSNEMQNAKRQLRIDEDLHLLAAVLKPKKSQHFQVLN